MKIISLTFRGPVFLSPTLVQEAMKTGFHFFFSFLVAWSDSWSRIQSCSFLSCHHLLLQDKIEDDAPGLWRSWKVRQPLSYDPQRLMWLLKAGIVFFLLGKVMGAKEPESGLSSGMVGTTGQLSVWVHSAVLTRLCLQIRDLSSRPAGLDCVPRTPGKLISALWFV